jgi:hypothetical protein
MQATVTMCRPVRVAVAAFDSRKCPQLMHFVFDDYLLNQKADKVLLAASWKEEDLPKLAATLDYLNEHGIAAVVFGPIGEYDYVLPRLLADAIRYHDPQLVDRERTPEVPVLDRRMRLLVTGKGVTYISTYGAMCRSGTCDKFRDRQYSVSVRCRTSDGGRLDSRLRKNCARTPPCRERRRVPAAGTPPRPAPGHQEAPTPAQFRLCCQ